MAKEEVKSQGGETSSTGSKPSGKRGRLALMGVLGAVMIAEGLVVFVLAKSFSSGSPTAAEAHGMAGLNTEEGKRVPKLVELDVVKLRAQNDKSQRTMVYDLTIFAVVSSENEAEVKELMERRRETIRDRFSRIVRSIDQARFLEPDLVTLRDQFKSELSQLVGKEGAIQEVLIPSIVSYVAN